MKYQVTTQVATEPISLEEAMQHLRIEAYGYPQKHPDEDYILSLITSAREWCERYTQKALATQTITVKLTEFSNKMVMPIGPMQSVSSIKYLDRNNALQTLATNNYYVDTYSNSILLEPGSTFPAVSLRENSIVIEYIAGYAGTNVLPTPIKSAMLLLIGSGYENRQEDYAASTKVTFNSLPMGVYNLLQPYRVAMGV